MHLYRLDAPASRIAAAFGAEAGDDPWAGDYVAPGRPAPVVVGDGRGGTRWRLRPRLWGVPPPASGTRPVTSVRNLSSPFWIGTLRHTQFRCLVPMTHYRRGDSWFTDPAAPLLAVAGIWRDSEIPSFAILTSGASGPLPVILRPETYDVWLRADIKIARHLIEEPPC